MQKIRMFNDLISKSVLTCGFAGVLSLTGCSAAPREFSDGSTGEELETLGTTSEQLVVGSCNVNVEPLRSVEIVNRAIVGDARSSNLTNGAWSFRRLIENMASSNLPAATDPFLRGIFESWLTDQFVNGELLTSRPAVQSQILAQFEVPNTSPRQFDLSRAPFELIAIASRIDLRSTTTGGEGRFVFALKGPFGNQSMTLITEFALPLRGALSTPALWAAKWHELDALDPVTQQAAFATKLQEITDAFSARGSMPGRPNGSAINQIRTNEIALNGPWQLREFRMNASGLVQPAITAVSPNHDAINQSQLLRDFISQNPVLNATNNTSFFNLKTPDIFGTSFFNGGKAEQTGTGTVFSSNSWSLSATETQDTSVAVDNFGLLTCNGCHNENKRSGDIAFYQISPFGNATGDGTDRLSQFMTVGDPTKNGRRPAELTRRATDMGSVLCAPSAIDLVVTAVTQSPTNPAPGQAVTFSATISNLGKSTKPVGAINGVAFFVDGVKVTWSDTNTQALSPGQTVTLTSNGGPTGSATWAATGGAHQVDAIVDDINRIAEGDENNNKLSIPLTVNTDLTVTNISWSPSFPTAGTPTRFTAVVKNNGTVATPAGTIIGVAFEIDGVKVNWSDTSTTSLAPGSSRTLTANFGAVGTNTWSATSGRKKLAAWVDDINRMTDVNRTNNKIDTLLVVP